MGYASKARDRREELLKKQEKIPGIEIVGETCAKPEELKYHIKRSSKELYIIREEEKKETSKLCPRCYLPMPSEDVLNCLSHDGKTVICSTCGQIESLEKLYPARAEGLRIGQIRAQAAIYGLDKNGNPKLPKKKEE